MDINATIIGQTIAMIVFVWFCMKFVWPLIIDMIEERQTKIADGLAAAEKGSRALEDAEMFYLLPCFPLFFLSFLFFFLLLLSSQAIIFS